MKVILFGIKFNLIYEFHKQKDTIWAEISACFFLFVFLNLFLQILLKICPLKPG